MNASLIAQQAAPLPHLVRSGGSVGLLILALGLMLTVWGVWNLLRVRNPSLLLVQTFCSLIPAVLCCITAFDLYRAFLPIAASPVAPKPAEIAELISRSLMVGIFGPLATVVPAALGIAALARTSGEGDKQEVAYTPQ